ncbi:MAG: RNA polymerase sigma factor [Balneolaceae bacterium]|nr:MAG: RNA polymerase sigma factor [Balneolaceae bacterium]
MSDPTSDKALMMQVKNGDLDALGVLFERYHHRLFGFFYRLTSRRDISADLVQDVFERILRYRTSYTGNGDFATWLFQIARNRHADHYRKMEKENEWEHPDVPHPAASNPAASHPNAPHSAGPHPAVPDSALPDTDDRLLLEQALARLDPDKKQALVLSRMEGFLYREIAEIMACTESAVKVRVFRGLQELRQIMAGLERQTGRKRIHPN